MNFGADRDNWQRGALGSIVEKGWVSSELGSFLESIKQYSGELGLGSNIRSLMHVKGLDYLGSLDFTEEGNSKMQKCEKCLGKTSVVIEELGWKTRG